jgi:hypothetical protein
MTDEILIGIPNKKPRRNRVTKIGLIERRAAILEIVRDAQPATVRQIFYLASVRSIVSKDDSGYDRVQGDLLTMRREGQLPYGWIVDRTRWQRRPVTFDSVDAALSDTAEAYRKAQYEILLAAEESERKLFQGLAGLVKQLAQRGAPESAP